MRTEDARTGDGSPPVRVPVVDELFPAAPHALNLSRLLGRVVPANPALLLGFLPPEAHEAADLDRDVSRSLALGGAEVLLPPSLADVAVVALAQACAEAEVAPLLLQVALRRPCQVALVDLRGALPIPGSLLAEAKGARDGGEPRAPSRRARGGIHGGVRGAMTRRREDDGRAGGGRREEIHGARVSCEPYHIHV